MQKEKLSPCACGVDATAEAGGDAEGFATWYIGCENGCGEYAITDNNLFTGIKEWNAHILEIIEKEKLNDS